MVLMLISMKHMAMSARNIDENTTIITSTITSSTTTTIITNTLCRYSIFTYYRVLDIR